MSRVNRVERLFRRAGSNDASEDHRTPDGTAGGVARRSRLLADVAVRTTVTRHLSEALAGMRGRGPGTPPDSAARAAGDGCAAAGPVTRMRATPSRLALRRRLPAPLPAGWLAGRFPHALRAGTFRQQRDYFLYVPTTVTRRERVPLLVMLHGCSQDARTFAEGTRMNEIADQHRFIVLYPQQSLRANPLRCWNWFGPRTRDGAGEAAAIVTLVRDVARRYPVDRSRVYVAGVSAGGAMTAILAFCYGAIFAACAIVAGVMYRAADSALGAAQAMRAGARLSPETPS